MPYALPEGTTLPFADSTKNIKVLRYFKLLLKPLTGLSFLHKASRIIEESGFHTPINLPVASHINKKDNDSNDWDKRTASISQDKDKHQILNNAEEQK